MEELEELQNEHAARQAAAEQTQRELEDAHARIRTLEAQLAAGAAGASPKRARREDDAV